jgi:hypothetical protein
MTLHVREISNAISPYGKPPRAMAMMRAYFDGSGTHDDSPAVVFSGIVGSSNAWEAFEGQWKARLDSPVPGKPPLKRFHMTDCVARTGEFEGYSEPESDWAIHDFRQIILRHELYGYSVAVSNNDWNTLITDDMRRHLGDAERYCFNKIINAMVDLVRAHSNDKELTLIFDDSPQRADAQQSLLRQYHARPRWEEVKGISFLSSTEFSPLQAADMVAWEIYTVAQAWLKHGIRATPRPHLMPFVESGRFDAGIIDKKKIEEIAILMKEKIK